MLFGCRHNCVYRAELSAELALVEGHAAFDEREQRVILADADIAARIEFAAALAHEDVARNGDFAAELLNAETPACRIATVARRTACFFTCHCLNSFRVRPARPRPWVPTPWAGPSSPGP